MALLVVATAALGARLEAQCEGLLEGEGPLGAVLQEVPKYGSTYVLVYPDRVGERIESLESLQDESLRRAVYAGSPAADLLPGSGVERYDLEEAGAGKIVEGLLAGELDAAVLWAPLAGLGIFQLDFNYELSMFTAGEPRAAPEVPGSTGAVSDELQGCAEEILALLESYGVIPAEKLVPLDIRDLLLLPPPERDPEVARAGGWPYAENCAKCHGPEGVAAEKELAPVDILASVRRFSFPGFLYIVWNGREDKGMPSFRGTLSQEQVEHIYQYARERSHGRLGITGEYPSPTGD